SQAVRTTASLSREGFRRGGWLKTLGAVLAGYLAVNAVVIAADAPMTRLPTTSQQVYSVLTPAGGFPALVGGGYLTARLRRGAAGVLAVLAAVMGVVSLAVTGDAAPLWYQLLLVVVGPTAAVVGGRIRARNVGGSGKRRA